MNAAAAGAAAPPVLAGEGLVLAEFPQAEPFDLGLQAGQYLQVSGPVGSGKTLLLRTLLALAPARQGRIALFGQDLAALPAEGLLALRKRTALLKAGDGDGLFPAWSAFDNLALAVRHMDEPCPGSEADIAARLAAEAQRYGIRESWLEEAISRRSRQQRAAIALWRALRSRPRLIVMDGPALHPSQVGDEIDLGQLLADALDANPAIVAAAESAAPLPFPWAPDAVLHGHMAQGRLELATCPS